MQNLAADPLREICRTSDGEARLVGLIGGLVELRMRDRVPPFSATRLPHRLNSKSPDGFV